jgi:hypothetical protein
MRKSRFLTFIIISSLLILSPITSQAADSTAPVSPPKGISADVWNAFYKVAFAKNVVADSSLKWANQPTVGLLGNATDDDVVLLSSLSSEIKKFCPTLAPAVKKNDQAATVKFYYVPKSEYTKYIEKAPTDADSYLNYTYYTSGGLVKINAVFNSDLTNLNDRKFYSSLRLLESLGLMSSTDDYSFKMLSYTYLNDGVFSSKDAEVLSLYCSKYVSGGQTFKSAATELSAALSQTPNQAPVFNPTISLETWADTAKAAISLGSPQNMFTSGEMTLEYSVNASNGDLIDSGSLSNSEARLKSEWEVNVAGLKPGNSYKFSLVLKNIIGSSKVFSESFKAAGERTKETTTKEVAAERVEQTISIFDLPDTIKLSEKTFGLVISTSSGLDPSVESLSPAICTVDSLEINLLKAGKCEFKISQEGDEEFLPADDVFGSFVIQGAKTTITCVKGKLTKKVTGTNPKCPSGYRKR